MPEDTQTPTEDKLNVVVPPTNILAEPEEKYEASDVFAWANNLFEFKEDLTLELFWINKNNVLYRTKTDQSLANQMQPLFIDNTLELVLDAAENGLAVIESNKHFEAAKYVSQTEHQRNLSALYVNEKKLASMPKDLQAIVLQAAKEASVHERKKDAELVAAAADRLKSRGAVLTSPDKARFIQLIAPIQDEVARELKATELLQLVRSHQM